jgi:hypothetical protein
MEQANIFHMMVTNKLDFDPGNIERRSKKIVFALEDDKWLWNYLHGLKEASNLLGNWSAIICAFYQGQFLYAWHNNLLSEEMNLIDEIWGMEEETRSIEIRRMEKNFQKTKDDCLTILLFRSKHLQNFESELKESRRNILQELIKSWLEAMESWFESTGWDPLGGIRLGRARMKEDIQDENRTRKNYYEIEWERLLKSTLQESIMVTENIIKSCLKEGSHDVNVFLGSSCLPNGIKVEECLDLKLVYDLGGLICTIEGDPGSNKGNDCTSWCIIRHNTSNLYLCMDLKEDEYRNKEHILDGTIDADYEGVVEVATKDGNTTVKSSELDGSYFDGCIEDFADRRGGINKKSCAAEALRTLTRSPLLDDFKLKCSVLYMIAMAFLVGKKDHLTLKWKGAAGHIEYQPPSKDTLDQSQRESNRALQKCTLLYTSSGTRFLGQDIIWEGDNGSSFEEAGGNMKVKTPVHTDEVRIISGHQSLWKYHKCLSGDFLRDHIEAILAKTQEEVSRKRMRVEEIAALAANKQNSGGGFGICGAKLEAHHEHRSRRAEAILHRGEYEIEDAHMYENTTVSGHLSLFRKDLRSLQVELENGTIGQNDQEVFVVRRDGSRCLHIFACNERPWPGYEDKTYYDFTWITDIVASTEGAAKRIMKDSLKGKQMTICRSSSTLKTKPKIDEFQTSGANLLVQKFKQKLQTFENVVVRDQTMCQRRNIILTKPRDSNDGWKFIIGNQKDYSQRNYFFKATEMQAVVCSATRYTTGGATLRTEIQGKNGSDQPSTSSNQPSTSSNLVASSGSCRELCETSQFLVWEPEVTATGRFSTCKAQDYRLQKSFYWG